MSSAITEMMPGVFGGGDRSDEGSQDGDDREDPAMEKREGAS
jgi:hypothetical protein